MDTKDTDVLVVGAGPVGMTLALTLRKFGARVCIVDRSPETTHTPRAAVVWPRTLEMLDLLGIAEEWSTKGVPLHGFTLTIEGDSGALNIEGITSHYPYPLGIGQDETETLLDAALRQSGADYRRGVEVSSLQITETGVQATLTSEGSDAVEIRAAWVVGCDGSNSSVREQAGIGFSGSRNVGVQLLQGDVCLRGSLAMEPNHGYLWSRTHPDQAGMFIMPTHQDGHCRVLVTLRDDGAHGDPSLGLLQEQVRRFLPDVTLIDPLWLNRFRTRHGIADSYRAGSALVAGDAAHVWVPVGGQGMNIGMQDAFNLGWKLGMVVHGILPESALDTYEAERKPIGAQNIDDTEALYGAILQTHTLRDSALRRLIPHLLGFAPLSHRVAERLAQMDFRYAPNSLLLAGHGGSGVSAGERAPDAFVARVETGETIRLYDLYRTGRWQVLGWALHPEDGVTLQKSLAANAPRGDAFPLDVSLVDATPEGLPKGSGLPVLRDMTRRATDLYGVSRSGIHLIRPDGVVAYSGSATQSLAEVLRRFPAHIRG